MGVSFSYTLEGAGWAKCRLDIHGQTANILASYLSDALYSLLEAVCGIVQGIDDTTASFAEEPGEYRWRFRRVEPDKIHIRILWFEQLWKHRPDSEGEVIFEVECRLRTFAGAVLAASQAILREHGMEGYRANWRNHDFPLRQQQKLKHLLDST